MYRVFKNKELDVRNSPLDRFASLAGKLIFCAKGACDTAAPIGSALGLMAGVDQLLEAKGKEPIFLPALAGLILPNSQEENIYTERRQQFKKLNLLDKEFRANIADKNAIQNLESSGIFTAEDIKEMKDSVENVSQGILTRKDELLVKIRSSYKEISSK